MANVNPKWLCKPRNFVHTPGISTQNTRRVTGRGYFSPLTGQGNQTFSISRWYLMMPHPSNLRIRNRQISGGKSKILDQIVFFAVWTADWVGLWNVSQPTRNKANKQTQRGALLLYLLFFFETFFWTLCFFKFFHLQIEYLELGSNPPVLASEINGKNMSLISQREKITSAAYTLRVLCWNSQWVYNVTGFTKPFGIYICHFPKWGTYRVGGSKPKISIPRCNTSVRV